jgi:MATE family multidrug resistance protein
MTFRQTSLPLAAPAMPLAEHVRRTLALALPVMVARAGLIVLVAVDTAMTGYAGAEELAYYGLGFAPQVPMIMVGIGLMMGTVVLTAQAAGAQDFRDCGATWRVALAHAVVLGLVFMGVTHLGHGFFRLIGQAPALAEGGGRVIVMFGWGMPALFLYVATSFFLEGINRPLPGMIVMLAANLVNVALNWVFIYGHAGAPALGAEGAALATSIVRWLMIAALIGYALLAVDRARYGIGGPIVSARSLARRMRRIGYPLALSHGMESSAFASLSMFAGLLGATELAGFQVAMNLITFAFMCAIGFATAASVRVANAVGRRDRPGLARAGWVAVGLAGLVMLGFAGLFASLPEPLARIYSDDPRVLAVAVPTVAVTALVLFADGTQGVLMGCLRGAADVWTPAVVYLIAFWGVQVPVGYLFGVAWAGGAPALILGALTGLTTAMLLLGARFYVISRRPVVRA